MLAKMLGETDDQAEARGKHSGKTCWTLDRTGTGTWCVTGVILTGVLKMIKVNMRIRNGVCVRVCDFHYNTYKCLFVCVFFLLLH